MNTPVWLVHGTTRGIGLSLVREAMERGVDVVAACRVATPALRDTGARVIEGVELGARDAASSLRGGLDAFGVASLDAVILNAGIYPDEGSLSAPNLDEVRRGFEVNALGQLELVSALLPRLGSGARIGLITSRMGSIADNTSGGSYAYRMSKAALNMLGRSLSVDLAPRGVAVAIIHPGFVRTDMTSQRGLIDADTSARGILDRMDQLGLGNTGTFWHQNGDVLPW